MSLIDADTLKEAISNNPLIDFTDDDIFKIIDNVPTVETFTKEDMSGAYNEGYACGSRENKRPQGEYFDMSKLRLMTVEECAGHTIDYAMGWKACIEWIKGGADMRGEDNG